MNSAAARTLVTVYKPDNQLTPDLRQRAREALARGDFAMAERLLAAGDVSLADLTENLRIYQAELEVQNAELRASYQAQDRALHRFQALFDQAPLTQLLVDRTGWILEANDAAARLFGFEVRHLRQHFLRRLALDEDQEVIVNVLHGALRRGTARQRVHLRGANGTICIGDLYAAMLPVEGEEVPPELVCTFVDLTAQLAQAAALHEVHLKLASSEAYYRSTVNTLSEGIIIFSPAGDVRTCNPAAETILGVSKLELRAARANLHGWPMVHEDGSHYQRDELPMARVLASGQPQRNTVLGYVRPAGERAWLIVNAEPIQENDAPITAVVVSLVDITQRYVTEAQLRKLSLAVEQSPVSIVITDLEGRIEYVNDAFSRISGYSREEALGNNPKLLQSGVTAPEIYQDLWVTLQAGQAWQGEFVNRHKDGNLYQEFARISPIHQPDGRITHYLAVKEDITEKQRTAAELECYRHHLEDLVHRRTAELADAKEVAEAANEAKSVFLANMSHEIRTPMNAILGLAHLLQRSNLNPAQYQKLEKIADAGRHLLSVINDILDISKIEAGKVVLEPLDFAPGAMLAHVGSLLAERARNKGLDFQVVTDQLPAQVHGDETRLVQALVNFVGNAVKFTQRGFIRLSGQVMEHRNGQVRLCFEVQDSGIGIATDKIPRLFTAFEQADSSIARQYGGTGLGLIITRRIAELMGGDVGVESQLGTGSRFWIRVWLGNVAANSATAIVPATIAARDVLANQYSDAKLLLAEDNPVNQEVALDLLREAGLIADVANDGAEAVAMAKCGNYALILMDMQMPKLDGLEATRAIRQLPGWATRPILAMTANAFNDDRDRCLAAGMNDHIPKPVDPEWFYQTLLKWLGRAAAAPITAALAISPLPEPRPSIAVSNRPLIDWRGLEARHNGKMEFVDKLAATVLRSMWETPAKLREAAQKQHVETLAFLAHSIKGMAGNLLAEGLFNQARLTEIAAREEHTATAAHLAEELADGLDCLLAELARR